MLGTADATPLQFWVGRARPAATCSSTTSWSPSASCPTGEPVTIAGVVTQVRARHEGAAFDSDVFAIADGTLPAQVQEAAEITTTRVDPEVYVPPTPGRAWCTGPSGDARAGALLLRPDGARASRSGIGRDGEPLYLNADFLDGSRGAHVSISGISGVATKTSFATFLLYSVFRSGRARRRRRDRQHQGADLQRQGRGPALPRPPQHPARRSRPARRTRGSGLAAGAVPRRAGLRAAAGRRLLRHARREPAG